MVLRGIFHPRFQAHHLPAVQSSMREAEVRVEDVGAVEGGGFDFDTGEQTDGVPTLYYEGMARIQKVARPTRREFVFDTADNQLVRVQIPLEPLPDGLEWKSNLRVRVTRCDEDPAMVGEEFWVKGWHGGSAAWTRTLHCNINAKQDES